MVAVRSVSCRFVDFSSSSLRLDVDFTSSFLPSRLLISPLSSAQITPDKCGGMSTEQCRNPETNIGIAARYFKQELDNQGGAFLKALGAYNGWNAGMSYDSATAARWGGCCLCQNNRAFSLRRLFSTMQTDRFPCCTVDYIFQMTNGWLIGKVSIATTTPCPY